MSRYGLRLPEATAAVVVAPTTDSTPLCVEPTSFDACVTQAAYPRAAALPMA